MGKQATGRYATAISDRSGQAFPYKEMVKNGQVHSYIFLNLNLNILS